MWPRTDLIDLLGIAHPIVQAPMAGPTTPALVAAVSNAGGIGSLGCARDDAESLRERAAQIRHATNKPYNLNFFVHTPPEHDADALARMRVRLQPLYDAFDLGPVPEPDTIYPEFDDSIVDALLELHPPVVSFHYGVPSSDKIAALKEAGSLIIASGTTVEEVSWLAESGADAVIAQGYEAGGHRGTREPSDDTGIGGMALIPQVADAVDIPVIAAGGIGDGRGIAAAFALGASGVQMGTAFLNTPEAGVNQPYRDALLRATATDTVQTRSISGRMARALRNRYVEEMHPHHHEALAFPLQYSLTGPLQAASAEAGSDEMLAMWAGQAVALNRAMPAAELIETLVEETRQAFASL